MVSEPQKNLDEMVTDMRKGRMTRRVFFERAVALGVSSSAAAALLAACGSSSASTGASNGPVTLTQWDYYAPPAPAFAQLMDNFMKAHPNIKLQRTYVPFADLKPKIIQASASGQLPDILLIDNPDHSAFSSMGVLADLTDRITKWGQADQFYPGPWKSTLWKGKNYGIPNHSNCLSLYYNEDAFKQANLQPPTSWDELRSTAKALSKNGAHGLSMSLVKSEEGTFQFLPFLWEAGADLDTLDSPAATEALQFLVNLLKDGSLSSEVINWTQQDAITQFIAQKAAMSINGPWQIPTLKQSAKFKWNVVPLPKGKQAASILGGENWTITRTTQHLDEAFTYLMWIQEPDVLKKYLIDDQSLPSRKDLAQDSYWQSDPIIKVFIDGFSVAKPRAYGPNYPKISNAVQQAFQAAMSGQMPPADALKQASDTVKPLLTA